MSKKKIALTVTLLVLVGIVALSFLSNCSRNKELDEASFYLLKSGENISGLTIDGKIGEGEWDSFKWHKVNKEDITIYLTNDDTDLYVAIEAKRDTTDGGAQDSALLCFLTGSYEEIEAGEFKTIRIRGDDVVLWMAWNKAEILPVKHARRVEEYSGNLSQRIGEGDAVRVHMKGEIVYAYFAENIIDTPQGLIGKTSFTSYRAYEFKVPLDILNLRTGQTVRIFGSIYDSVGVPHAVYYPNFRTKFLALPYYSIIDGPPVAK